MRSLWFSFFWAMVFSSQVSAQVVSTAEQDEKTMSNVQRQALLTTVSLQLIAAEGTARIQESLLQIHNMAPPERARLEKDYASMHSMLMSARLQFYIATAFLLNGGDPSGWDPKSAVGGALIGAASQCLEDEY